MTPLWQLLMPTLVNPAEYVCATAPNGMLAVIILCPAEDVCPGDQALACRLHAVMGRGVLIVF